MSLFVGIDPGKKGGICAINDREQVFLLERTPLVGTTKKVYDEQAMANLIRDLFLSQRVKLVCLEKVGAMPGQGVTSMFNFGMGYGLWRGFLAMCDLPRMNPTPAKWKKEMLAGIPADDKKAMSITAAKQLLPQAELVPPGCRKPHDGLAEAALLALYAKRAHGGS